MATIGVAQQASRLSIDLFLALQQTPKQDYALVELPVLVKGDLRVIQRILEENGGHYKYGVKNIASVKISLAIVEELLKSPAIQRIEYRDVIGHNLYYEDSVMLQNNNALDVHAGTGGLPYPFLGDGVLLGVIDDGFELNHPDFLNPDSTTRVANLWDQGLNNTSYPEQYYGYGSSWNSAQINAHQCSQVPGGHGSHVMGTAAGNARAADKYKGIAPKADLACVKISNNNFLSSFVDGIHYLFSKADQRGQVCAINSSLGSYSSGHDAKDLYSELMDNLITAKAGRSFVQAGGNARAYNFHLGVQLNNNTAKSWFKWHNSNLCTHSFIYADTADFKNINFSLQLINPTTYQIEAQTLIFNVVDDFVFNGSVASYSQFLFNDVNGDPVVLEMYIDLYEGVYEIYFKISSNINIGYWQLTTSGTGKYDVWSKEDLTGTSDILQNINIPNYANPNNIQSIVGFWTCSDKVITVSSYQNRSSLVTWTNDTIFIGTTGFPKYGISHFSSLGPTRTGLQKPDITAPGGQVMSAAPILTLNSYKNSGDTRLDQDGWHVSNRGTSMAAPMVAGAAALYLQCKPYANYAMVKQAILNSAKLDSFVFMQALALPNIHWGYGKLDVLELVKSCLIYGCTDSTALNYNQLATVLDGSCFYNTTALNQIKDATALRCQPNPFSSSTTIFYELPDFTQNSQAALSIYNVLGQTIFYQPIDNREGQILFNNDNLAKGVYWVVLEQDGRRYAQQQLVLN